MDSSKKIFTILFSLLFWVPLKSDPQIKNSAFVSPSSVKETREQLKKLPKDNIWWTVNGTDMAWNNKNLHQILTTVNVYRSGPVSALDYNSVSNINDTEVNTPVGLMNFETFIHHDESTVMGVVIAHKGKIIFESYPRMQEHEKPIYWSVSKVLPATLLRIYEERKQLDVNKPIDFYIDALKGTSYAGIRIRNILDMASGLDCSDNYETFESCYYLYSMSIGDGFRTEDAEDTPYDFVINTKIERNAPQGEIFSYSGVDTFVLAWLVEELSGMPYQDALSKEIWTKIGAESDASFIAPRYGIPISHGGFLANMRDMIRFGLLFTPSYKTVSEEKIISDEHIDLILTKGNPKLMQNLYQNIPTANMPDDLRHNIYQWDAVYENGDFFKGGWAGQGLLINAERDTVAVWTGYKKDEQHQAREMREIMRELLDKMFEKK